MNAIPDTELEKLLETVDTAVRFARSGRIAAGFHSLYAGQEYAEALAAEGEEWAEALARRYRELTDRYTEQWGEKLVERGFR